MYYIKGKVVKENRSDYLVVESNNVGYKIYTNEVDKEGSNIKIYLNMTIFEDKIMYAGFKTEFELEVFNTLTEINGIGVKTALRILKSTPYKNLVSYSINDDFRNLSKCPYLNSDNYMSIGLKLKKKFKNVKLEGLEVAAKTELYKIIKAMGYTDSQYDVVSFIDKEKIPLNEKLSKSLEILNEK